MKLFITLFVLVTVFAPSRVMSAPQGKNHQQTTVSSESTPGPTVESNVRTALSIINNGCVEIILVRKAVIVGIPCRLPDGSFDHSFQHAIMEDQRLAREQKLYKSRWMKSRKLLAWVFRDGKHPYRERVKEGGLEADRYDPTDKELPDYIRKLVREDDQKTKLTKVAAPPYYWKMDVDYGHGVRNFFRQELPHFILRKSTKQSEIAEILKRRSDALAQQASAARETQFQLEPQSGQPVKAAGVLPP